MKDRALQALVKLALEPEWEAVFEPNSYGFVRLVGAAERVPTLEPTFRRYSSRFNFKEIQNCQNLK